MTIGEGDQPAVSLRIRRNGELVEDDAGQGDDARKLALGRVRRSDHYGQRGQCVNVMEPAVSAGTGGGTVVQWGELGDRMRSRRFLGLLLEGAR